MLSTGGALDIVWSPGCADPAPDDGGGVGLVAQPRLRQVVRDAAELDLPSVIGTVRDGAFVGVQC